MVSWNQHFIIQPKQTNLLHKGFWSFGRFLCLCGYVVLKHYFLQYINQHTADFEIWYDFMGYKGLLDWYI